VIYDLRDILLWIVRGWWQYFVLRHNLYRWLRLPESLTAPDFWLDYFSHYQWYNYLDSDGRPNHIIWASRYRTCATSAFNAWMGVQTRRFRDEAVSLVRNFTGTLLYGYITFSTWIDVIWNRVGTYLPWWASSLASAAVQLYDWFPLSIVNAWKSWDTIWAEIKGDVWSWALARFDAAKNWVANHAPWVIDWINFLATWYNAVGAWVTAFKGDPYGTVVGWLGVAWSTWLSVQAGIVNFYNSVWVPFSTDLHDFLDHPMLFLYDVFDDEVDNYIETLSRWVGQVAEKIITWSWGNT